MIPKLSLLLFLWMSATSSAWHRHVRLTLDSRSACWEVIHDRQNASQPEPQTEDYTAPESLSRPPPDFLFSVIASSHSPVDIALLDLQNFALARRGEPFLVPRASFATLSTSSAGCRWHSGGRAASQPVVVLAVNREDVGAVLELDIRCEGVNETEIHHSVDWRRDTEPFQTANLVEEQADGISFLGPCFDRGTELPHHLPDHIFTDGDSTRLPLLLTSLTSLWSLGYDLHNVHVLAYDNATATLLRRLGLVVTHDPLWVKLGSVLDSISAIPGQGAYRFPMEKLRFEYAHSELLDGHSWLWFDSDVCWSRYSDEFFNPQEDVVVFAERSRAALCGSKPYVEAEPGSDFESEHLIFNFGTLSVRGSQALRLFLSAFYVVTWQYMGSPCHAQKAFNDLLYDAFSLRLRPVTSRPGHYVGVATREGVSLSVRAITAPETCVGCPKEDEDPEDACVLYHPTYCYGYFAKIRAGMPKIVLKEQILRDSNCWFTPSDWMHVIGRFNESRRGTGLICLKGLLHGLFSAYTHSTLHSTR